MGAEIHIFCPHAEEGAARSDQEDDLEEFLGTDGEITGGGSGIKGYNIDLALAEDADWEQWVVRIRAFLREQLVRPGTFVNVFPPNWKPGDLYRRIKVY